MNAATSVNGGVTWADLNLNEIVTDAPATTERTELGAGTYTFRLVGAKPNPYEPGTTDIDLVVTEGPNAKRHLFAKIPAPSVTKYAQQWAAILLKRLGISQLPGEDLIDTLNRGASTAGPITGEVEEETYFSKKYNEMRSKPKLQFFSLQSAV